MLEELAWSAQVPDLAHPIRREDIPLLRIRMPRARSPQQDQLISAGTAPPHVYLPTFLLLMGRTGIVSGNVLILWMIASVSGRIDGRFTSSREVENRAHGPDRLVSLFQSFHRLRFFRSFSRPVHGRLRPVLATAPISSGIGVLDLCGSMSLAWHSDCSDIILTI